LQWSLDEARYTDAAWLVIVASWHWMSCGLGTEATGWLMHLLPHRHTLAADLRLAILLWAYAFAAGRAAFRSYERYTAEVMELLESCPDKLLRAAAWHWIATTTPDAADANVASEWGGKLDEAEHWLSQSLVYHSEPQRITIYTVERLFIAARLATAKQQYPRAATLFGLADQIHNQVYYAIGGPMRSLADAALATVRAALEPAVFADAFAAGRQMSLDGAFITILAPGHVGGVHGTILR
jgi:hypothetical protein